MTVAQGSTSVTTTTRDSFARFLLPQTSIGVVPLAAVHARLDQARGGAALVVAPAGYGKTSQVALWAANDGRPVVWADLGPNDRDPGVLIARLASMLETLAPRAEPVVASHVEPAQPLAAAGAVAELFRVVDGPVIIVFDDVHLVDDRGRSTCSARSWATCRRARRWS